MDMERASMMRLQMQRRDAEPILFRHLPKWADKLVPTLKVIRSAPPLAALSQWTAKVVTVLTELARGLQMVKRNDAELSASTRQLLMEELLAESRTTLSSAPPVVALKCQVALVIGKLELVAILRTA